MKEIGGLEERLAMLEKLKEKACAFSEEQADMAKVRFRDHFVSICYCHRWIKFFSIFWSRVFFRIK